MKIASLLLGVLLKLIILNVFKGNYTRYCIYNNL
jgi:hypothetical protein